MDSPHPLSSAFPEVSFTPRQKHSSFCLREASRTGDLSLSLWIVFRLSETPQTLRLFTDIKVLCNDLHFPSLVYPLLKIADCTVHKGFKWKQPRKRVGRVTYSHDKCMLSTSSRAIPGTETHLRARHIRAALRSTRFSGETNEEEGVGQGRRERRREKRKIKQTSAMRKIRGERVRQASRASEQGPE